MSDKLPPTIKIEQQQSATWAQEETLRRLNDKMSRSNEILSRLGARWRVNLDNIQAANEATGTNNRALGENTRGLKTNTREQTEATESYSRAVDNLRYSMGRYKDSVSNMITGSTDPLKRLPEVAEGVGNGLAALTGRSRLLSVGFMALGAAASFLIDRFLQGGETFRSMMQSGVLFDGSITGMISSVRSAGLTLEEGARLVSQYSQAMIVQGEARFFRSVEGLTRQFANLGMNMPQGAEAMLELQESMRMSGELFMMSERDRIAANMQTLQLQQAEAVLTGQSVQRQREQERRIRESARLQILQATLTPQQLAQQRLARERLVAMGLPTEAIEGILMEAITGAATRASAQARISYGPLVDEVVQMVRSGTAAGIGDLAQRERVLTYQEQLLRGTATGLAYGRDQAFVEQIAPVLQMGRQALRAVPGSEAELRQRQDRQAAIARGEQVLSEQTVALFNAQNQAAQAAGRVEAAFMRLADPAITTVITSLSGLATHMNNLVGATGIGGMGQALAGIATNPLVLAGAGGAAGLMALRTLFGRGTATIPTPGVTATGPAALGAPGMGAITGAGRLVRGTGVGLLGAGAGMAAGATGAPDWLSGALTGAGTGAAIGSIIPGIGTGIGAAIGAALGGATGLFGAPTATTTPATMPDLAQNFRALNTTLIDQLGPTGTLANALERLIIAVNSNGAATVTAIRQI